MVETLSATEACTVMQREYFQTDDDHWNGASVEILCISILH